MTALDSGEAVIEVFEGGSHYIRVKVARQEKITKQQVINLAGPAPVTVYSKSLGDIRITYENILTDEFIRGSLENYYRYTVMPMLKGIPLDAEYSMSTGFYNAAPEGFGRWLWMMYGHLAPTQEEIIHMWLDLSGIIPIAGTIAEAYNTYLYYIEGDIVSALIYAGVVVFSAVGDYLLIKDIASEVKFSFSSDAAAKLASVSDDVVDAATKQSIIRYLDDAEGAGKALENANYAQKTYSSKFSAEGQKIYSDLAGKPINTVDDLANALKSGTIKPSDVPIDYIVRDGNTLILNTRSSQALTQAGIPRNQWNAINQTGNSLFEEMLTNQLSRNGLTSAGTSTVKMSGGEN